MTRQLVTDEYVAVDVETTGLQPQMDRLIEVGAVVFDAGGIRDTFTSLVNPHRSLPHTIRRLTGLHDEDTSAAPDMQEVLPKLERFIGARRVVGHGAAFDLRFLTGLGVRGLPGPADTFDTLDLARIVLPEAPAHGLGALAQDLGLPHPRAHRAGDDALATAHLFMDLAGRVAAMPDGLRSALRDLVLGRGDSLEHFFVRTCAAFQPSAAPPYGNRFLPGVLVTQGAASSSPVTADPMAVRALLDHGGAAAAAGLEARSAQIEMATAIAQTFRRGGRLVAEAGTGTGKSIAYLVPSLSFALERGDPVVVATSTINLQEQLFRKDLPRLAEWYPWPFVAAMVKGRSNYLCGRRWRRYLREPAAGPGAEEVHFKLKVTVWLTRTLTGDRAELRLQGYENWLWERIAALAPECMGSGCHESECFLARARRAAGDANLIVANHDLLLADALADGAALPQYQHLVVDEAHHLEDAATRGMSQAVEEADFRALLRGLRGDLPSELALLAGREPAAEQKLRDTAEELQARSEEFFAIIARTAESLVTRTGRRVEQVRLTEQLRGRGVWVPARDAARVLAEAGHRVRALVAELVAAIDPAGVPDSERAADAVRRADSAVRGLNRLLRTVEETVVAPAAERVYWLSLVVRSQRASLHAAPVTVGPALAEAIYANKQTLVLTSATLALADSFDFYLSRVGLERSNLEELMLASPFDYLRQALVCIPTDFSSHDDPAYAQHMSTFIERLLEQTGGRTLVLFTSHEQLQDVNFNLRASSELDGITILAQGIDGNRTQLSQRFMASRRAVLLGTNSFWEGVDLPGDALQCVVIQKLPFAVPTEPVFAARSETLDDPFRTLALPQAALRLKQGFGRLIRTSSDRGAVVLLDQRIRGRAYGRAFLEVLPRAASFVGPAADIPRAIATWLSRESDPDAEPA